MVVVGSSDHWQRILVTSAMVYQAFSRFASLMPIVLASEIMISVNEVAIFRVICQFSY